MTELDAVGLSYRDAVANGQLWRIASSVCSHLDVRGRQSTLSLACMNPFKHACSNSSWWWQAVHLVSVLAALWGTRAAEASAGSVAYASASLWLAAVPPCAGLYFRHRMLTGLSRLAAPRAALAVRCAAVLFRTVRRRGLRRAPPLHFAPLPVTQGERVFELRVLVRGQRPSSLGILPPGPARAMARHPRLPRRPPSPVPAHRCCGDHSGCGDGALPACMPACLPACLLRVVDAPAFTVTLSCCVSGARECRWVPSLPSWGATLRVATGLPRGP